MRSNEKDRGIKVKQLRASRRNEKLIQMAWLSRMLAFKYASNQSSVSQVNSARRLKIQRWRYQISDASAVHLPVNDHNCRRVYTLYRTTSCHFPKKWDSYEEYNGVLYRTNESFAETATLSEKLFGHLWILRTYLRMRNYHLKCKIKKKKREERKEKNKVDQTGEGEKNRDL